MFFDRHMANSVFVVCPKCCTRQTKRHTANKRFPVVEEEEERNTFMAAV